MEKILFGFQDFSLRIFFCFLLSAFWFLVSGFWFFFAAVPPCLRGESRALISRRRCGTNPGCTMTK
jgi:hypothetical protein